MIQIFFPAAQARQSQCGGDQCLLTHPNHKYDLRRKSSHPIGDACEPGSTCAALPPKRPKKSRNVVVSATKGNLFFKINYFVDIFEIIF